MNIDTILRRELTGHQRLAAIDPSREVLTLACAGSGKSRTLAYRVAWLIANGAAPSEIVAFTFTEKAAESIKLSITRALTKAGFDATMLGAMYVGTIHSYCKLLLGQMDARYRQFEVLDENRLKLYLISRYPQLGLKRIKNARNTVYFETIKQVAEAWKLANDELIDLNSINQQEPLMGAALTSLSQRLDQDEFIDFSLMIRLVVEALRAGNPGAQNAVKTLKHLMVDEYQDVNPAQEALIRELHAVGQSLFVVGDDDQSIYGWRGADVGNILTFAQRYPKCSEHQLSQNFRSTAPIVDGANQFIAAELGAVRITKQPTAVSTKSPRDFSNLWFPAQADEADWVAQRILSLLGTAYEEPDGTVRGLTLSDFAILMRATKGDTSRGQRPRHVSFTDAMRARNIDYTLEAGGGVFERTQVRVLRDSFELLRNGSPSRDAARDFFQQSVLQSFPNANFDKFANVLSQWGRLIHTPITGTRRRVFPQALVHDLLHAFALPHTVFPSGVMHDIGMFSKMLQDVESVYLSIDTAGRFGEILNFLTHVAEAGYDTANDEVLLRPNTVTVSTVHRVKGLEWPVVFIVDVEARRFPGDRRQYQGWLPANLVGPALARGAYAGNPAEEARLFYTALTRAERYLYVSGSALLPGGRQQRRQSPFALRLTGAEVGNEPTALPVGLTQHPQAQRIEEIVVPTSYSDLRYYLKCPRDYQFRKSFGFSPPLPEMFGFGQTVHASVGKLHEQFTDRPPTRQQARQIAEDNFHLKHIPPSADPVNRPGGYERAKEAAAQVLENYADDYATDFARKRQVEARFEIPVNHAVVSGAIDLMLQVDQSGNIVNASVIDFKAMEGGEEPEEFEALHWTELALQVQLYAKAAREVLGENAQTGAVHLLKDGKRIEVPVDEPALQAATANVEWAVDGILAGDFPMRPHPEKCENCDFRKLCPAQQQNFSRQETPPEIHTPGQEPRKMARAFSEFGAVQH